MTTSPFQIPAASTKPPSGSSTESTSPKSEKGDYTIEDLLIDLDLLPRKRSDARHKAIQILLHKRLRVRKVDGNYIEAEVRGEHGVYVCGHDPKRHQWRCTCPHKGQGCSHLIALRAVTAVKGME